MVVSKTLSSRSTLRLKYQILVPFSSPWFPLVPFAWNHFLRFRTVVPLLSTLANNIISGVILLVFNQRKSGSPAFQRDIVIAAGQYTPPSAGGRAYRPECGRGALRVVWTEVRLELLRPSTNGRLAADDGASPIAKRVVASALASGANGAEWRAVVSTQP